MNKTRLAKTFVYTGVLNFALYGIIGLSIGGSAAHESGGKYFVSNHGNLTEVSKWVYSYSQLHAYSLIITFTLLVVGISILEVRKWR